MDGTTTPLEATSSKLSKHDRRDLLIKEASCHATMVCAGWSDSSSGPLLPYIQAYFGISYTVVSMLFIGQMVGFLTAGFSNSYLTERFGLGKVIVIGAVVQLCGYIFLVPGWTFPLMPVCYVFLGFGMALQDAQANTYIATLPNVEFKMGILHASYGVGALLCPLAATAFASSGFRFSYFYSISIGIAALNASVLLYAFRFSYRIPTVLSAPLVSPPNERHQEDGIELSPLPRVALPRTDTGDDFKDDGTTTPATLASLQHQYPPQAPSLVAAALAPHKQKGILRQTLENRTVWICCLFILVYVGSEVSMGGWIVTFLIDNRNGGPSAGYVATGFWGGLTLGRAVTSPFNVWFGEKRVIWLYLGLAACLEFAIWFSHNLIGNAVTVALVGFFLGPIYPITISICTKVLPRSLHASGIGFIAAAGQAGSAIFPFTTGALAQRFSPAALQPVLLTLFTVQAAIWIFCPSPDRKRE